jgi:predicted enzyme related to lactoylglutathione lyase
VDLSSPDPAAAGAFYGELLGWEIVERAPADRDGGYWIFTSGGEEVAGLGPLQGNETPPHWTIYVAVADAGAAVATVEAHGGRTLAGPIEIPDTGRMAVLADGADGAAFAVWEPLGFRGAGAVNRAGAWTMAELDTRDVDGAERFYRAVFEWELERIEAGGALIYGSLKLDGRLVAGLLPMGDQFPPQVPAHWIPYFGVDDLERAATRAGELGGRALTKPVQVPQGRFVVLADPHGAGFAVWQGSYDPPPGA